MPTSDRKEQLFDHVLRLRRVEREFPRNRDLVTVRAALESELGETVSQRLAARLLGVSHTALRRWIEAGDLPRVFTEHGRMEVPVSALLTLRERVDESRASGARRLHVLEPVMTAGRRRAEKMSPRTLVEPSDTTDPHERAQRRSLAYHRAVARRLRRPMVDEALHTIWKWREQGRIADRYADQWETLLRRSVAEIKRTIAEDSQWADDLRQNSPFAGTLSEPERRRIIRDLV